MRSVLSRAVGNTSSFKVLSRAVGNMSSFKVTLSCALLLLQGLAQLQSADPDVDNPYASPLGLQALLRQDQPPISLPTLYQELRNQSTEWVVWQLVRMFTAAGDGDEFYNLETDLGAPNRRTAQVTMKMLLQFTTQEETETAWTGAMAYTVETLGSSAHLRHPLEALCDQLDEQLRRNSNLSAAYGRLMADSHDSTSTPKRYFSRVFNMEAGYFPFEPNYVSIPGNLKLMLRNGFREKLRRLGRTEHDEYVAANAIYNVGRKDRYHEKVEQIREKVQSEILPLMLKEKLAPFFFDPNWFVKEMLLRLERYMSEQPDMRDELLNEKQVIVWKSKTENLASNSLRGFSFVTDAQKNITT